MANELEKRLNELTGRLTKAYGDGLLSVVLYGSAASGEYQGSYSDLNVLCVLRTIGPEELRLAEPIIRWWHSLDNPSPLLLREDELHNATDCFAIEFHDIVECHRILAGADVVKDLVIDDRYYRGQVEHELRAKLLRLRQKAGGLLSDRDSLARLMAESVSTFCHLARHALRLAGETAPLTKREGVGACAARFGFDASPFYTLLDLRSGAKSARDLKTLSLLADYMQQIESLTGAVDQMGRQPDGTETKGGL
jgi:predicted nucleotidyltransferase